MLPYTKFIKIERLESSEENFGENLEFARYHLTKLQEAETVDVLYFCVKN